MNFGLGAKIERYVMWKGLSAFLLTTVTLTAIVWMTQALRQIDLVTAKGQTLQLFLVISSLAIPSLVVVLAPIALLIAILYTMNTLHQESELVIIAAAGGSPKRVTRPLLWLSLFVALLTAFLSIYVAPAGLKQLRGHVTQVRADLISSIMIPGAFTDVDSGLMVHIKERSVDGFLGGILISDTRNPEISFRYLADRGALVETGPSTYLVMQNGNIVRREKAENSSSIIEFESYAFDLSQFRERTTNAGYRTKERGTMELLGDLLSPDAEENSKRSELGAELHSRFVAPLYAFSFAMVAMLFMASPQTTRSGQGIAILSATAVAVAIRGVGFAAESLAESSAVGVVPLYAIPIGATIICLILLWQNVRLDFAQRVADRLADVFEKLVASRRAAKADREAFNG
ncbi:LPS export ABC transporter permease LptF [Pararhizobium sp. IMCC21322]|uniref:LPS export ABC transporter permease LptF n=1 Tax=Pararhizobium sp. IMCC21322 TaxID=3067903 RepID=UPI0027420D44|nr:LPS export ABC transporter permease LptF [Pararhizobium sp. IMCC21322]